MPDEFLSPCTRFALAHIADLDEHVHSNLDGRSKFKTEPSGRIARHV